ncbi:hypothetical protein F4861DRAFT_492317 [Xylaria intraflava]|nr:hypothetical protein F4861DRAFT_492317 [Xylaria intraflava]
MENSLLVLSLGGSLYASLSLSLSRFLRWTLLQHLEIHIDGVTKAYGERNGHIIIVVVCSYIGMFVFISPSFF